MKLWVDDVRPAPQGWTWVTSFAHAALYIMTSDISEISLDHDLGGDKTGYDVAKLIERRAYECGIKPPKWSVHSANPVGRRNIEAAMTSAERKTATPE